jgi:transcriptional regulator GlxA family with amidase domain
VQLRQRSSLIAARRGTAGVLAQRFYASFTAQPHDDLAAWRTSAIVYCMVARVVVVGFEDMQALDLIGPLDVFCAASVVAGKPVYRTITAATGGGERRVSCGISVRMLDLRRIEPRPGDTVIVVGGPTPAVANALVEPELVAWLRGALPVASRIASVCTSLPRVC